MGLGRRNQIGRGRTRKENKCDVCDATGMRRAWGVLAFRELKPSVQVAELAYKAVAAPDAEERRHHGESCCSARSREQIWCESQRSRCP